MKRIILSFLLTTIAIESSFSQGCTEATILQKPGEWKEGMKGSTSGIAAVDLAREKNVVAALHAMIKSTYSPMGVSASFNGGYNRAEPAIPLNSYIYSIMPLNYYCEDGSIKIVHETSTYFHIGVNFFDGEIYEEAQGDRALAEGFNVIPDMPIEKDGYYFFKEKDVTLAYGIPGKSSMWLITYAGKLPYSYVSKIEFLEKRKKNLADEMANASSGFKDVLKNLEIEKTYKEAEYKNDAEKLKQYMKMDYQPRKGNYEKLLGDNEKQFQPAFTKLETSLKMASAELNQPAIVKRDPNDGLSYLFTNDEDPFGQVLIKPNPAYFNTKLARSSPQFFCVYVVGNYKDPIASKAMTDIIDAVDFGALKGMLGK